MQLTYWAHHPIHNSLTVSVANCIYGSAFVVDSARGTLSGTLMNTCIVRAQYTLPSQHV